MWTFWLQSVGSVAVTLRLSYPVACEIFLEQVNLCLLRWQADSSPEPPGKSVLDISKLQASSVNIFSCCKPPENFQCTVFKSRYKWAR